MDLQKWQIYAIYLDKFHGIFAQKEVNLSINQSYLDIFYFYVESSSCATSIRCMIT